MAKRKLNPIDTALVKTKVHTIANDHGIENRKRKLKATAESQAPLVSHKPSLRIKTPQPQTGTNTSRRPNPLVNLITPPQSEYRQHSGSPGQHRENSEDSRTKLLRTCGKTAMSILASSRGHRSATSDPHGSTTASQSQKRKQQKNRS